MKTFWVIAKGVTDAYQSEDRAYLQDDVEMVEGTKTRIVQKWGICRSQSSFCVRFDSSEDAMREATKRLAQEDDLTHIDIFKVVPVYNTYIGPRVTREK